MAVFWVLLGALLVALLWTFGAQNSQPVDLQYFGIYVDDAPLWLVAVVPAVLGLLMGFLAALPGRVRGLVATRRLRREVRERERTIEDLQRSSATRPLALPGEAGTDATLSDVPDTASRSRLWR